MWLNHENLSAGHNHIERPHTHVVTEVNIYWLLSKGSSNLQCILTNAMQCCTGNNAMQWYQQFNTTGPVIDPSTKHKLVGLHIVKLSHQPYL